MDDRDRLAGVCAGELLLATVEVAAIWNHMDAAPPGMGTYTWSDTRATLADLHIYVSGRSSSQGRHPRQVVNRKGKR